MGLGTSNSSANTAPEAEEAGSSSQEENPGTEALDRVEQVVIPRLLAEAREQLGSGDPANAVKALDNVVKALRVANRGDEAAVLREVLKAKEEHRKVAVSTDCPGPDWEVLM